MRFIPTKVHGVLDYLVGIALIAAPWLFGFASVGGAPRRMPMGLGHGRNVVSQVTRYEWGPFGVIPMPVHLVFDLVASAFLAASPWIFGFADESLNVWLPHLVVGVTVIVVVIFSKPQPAAEARRRV